MKLFSTVGVMVAVMMFITTTVFAQEKGKIGYVDLSRLFDEYYKTKEQDKILEAEHKEYEQESKTRIERIREQQGKLALLAADKKNAVEQEIVTMKNDLLEFDRQQKTSLTKKRNEKIREILLEIEKIVSDYAEQNGYAMIFNDRVLIYGEPTQNLTENVLKNLNAKKPEK